MIHTVLWTATAERALTAIWVDAQDRSVVTLAANLIDHQLRTDPAEQGESRESGRRILIVPPLAVKFRVLSEDRIVRVLHVWRIPGPKRD